MIIANDYVLHYPREVDLDNHRRMHSDNDRTIRAHVGDSADARHLEGFYYLVPYFRMGNRSRLQRLADG